MMLGPTKTFERRLPASALDVLSLFRLKPDPFCSLELWLPFNDGLRSFADGASRDFVAVFSTFFAAFKGAAAVASSFFAASPMAFRFPSRSRS